MIIKKAFSLIFIISIFISGCGFKIVNQAQKIDFSFSEIKITGDKKINYNIKNKILSKTNDDKNKLLVLNIKTKKIKKIKEKNIKNEITKYEIFLISKVEFFLIKDDIRANFSKSVTGDFTAGNNYSATINNEKKIVDDLVESLSEKILDEIVLKLNDL